MTHGTIYPLLSQLDLDKDSLPSLEQWQQFVQQAEQDVNKQELKEAQYVKNQQSREVLTALLQLSLEEDSLDELLQRALDLILATSWLPVKAQGSIFLVEKDADVLTLKVHHDLAKPLLTKCAQVPFGRCLCGQAAASGKTLFTNCVDEQHETTFKGMQQHGHYNVPIWLDGQVIGVINLYVAHNHQKDEQEVTFLDAAANTLTTLITRKRAEAALSEQRTFLRQVIDINPALIFAKDRDGRFTLANQALANVYGVTVEELIGKTDGDFVKNQDRSERFLLEDREIMDTLEEKEVPMDITVDLEGNTRRFLTTKRPLIGSDGLANQVLGVVTDVTQLAQVEDELRKSEVQTRLIIETSLEAIISINDQGVVIGWNRQAENTFGWTQKEAMGKTLTETIVPEQYKEAHEHGMKRFLATKKPKISNQLIEITAVHQDGHEFPIELSISPVKTGDSYTFNAFIRDISQRKQTEEQIQYQAQLLQDISEAVMSSDMNYVVRSWNKAAEQLYGFTAEEIVGKPIADFIDTTYENYPGDVGLNILLEKGSFSDRAFQKTKTGLELHVSGSISLFRDNEGNPAGMVAVNRDITNLIQLEKENQELLEVRSRQVTLSTRIAQEVAAAPNLQDLYHRIVHEIQEQFHYYHTQLLLYDNSLETMALVFGYGEVGEKMLAMNHSMPLGIGIIGSVAASGNSILYSNVKEVDEWQANPLLPNTQSELAIPIKMKERVLGVLDVQSDRVDHFTKGDQLLLEGLCGQIAIAIDNTRLRQEMETNLNELTTLQRQLSREGWINYQKKQGKNHGFGYDLTNVYALNSDRLTVENGSLENGNSTLREVSEVASVKSELKIRGEVFGSINVQDDPERPLTEEELALLTAVSEQVAEALEAARLFENTQSALAEQERLTADLETVAQVSTVASTILDIDPLIQSVVDLAKNSFGLYHAHCYLTDEIGTTLHLVAGSGSVGRLMVLEGREIDIQAQSLVARAARTKGGVMENNVRKIVDFLPHPLLPLTEAEIAIPMIVGDKLIGIIDLQSDVEDFFTEDDLKIQQTLASQIGIAIENARQYAKQVETAVKLREVDQLKSEFLASMSHELRTPLNSIIGFADVLLEGLDGELNDRMEEDVRLIRQSGRHLRDLIGDILDMSKIESGHMELRREIVDMRMMAEDIMATAQSLANEKSLAMYLNMDGSVDTIEGDSTRIRQVLWNVMGNAIKFTDKGSVTLKISSKAEHLLISVRDTGIGIKEEHIPIVFQQFRQVEGGLARPAGGTGLGMPITKNLVEIQGGSIWIESVWGQGSTFFFTLPYIQPQKAEVQA